MADDSAVRSTHSKAPASSPLNNGFADDDMVMPPAEVSPFGTDISLLRQNLRLTPTERLRKMVAYARFVDKYRGTLRPLR